MQQVQQMRADLVVAMRARDRTAVDVLRSTLAALSNAEARPIDDGAPVSRDSAGGIAGATAGVGSTEVARRVLTGEEIRSIIAAERDERLHGATDLEGHGAVDHAARLRAEAAVLDRYL